MAEQPARLVRRISPYGYYVIRGIKGLSKVRGKLLVRWSLLVSGALEVEVCDKPDEEDVIPGSVTSAENVSSN